MNHPCVTISHGSTLRQLALFASALVDSETNESFSCYHFTQFNSETACMFVSAVVDTKTNESPNFSRVTISRGSAQRQLALSPCVLKDWGTDNPSKHKALIQVNNSFYGMKGRRSSSGLSLHPVPVSSLGPSGTGETNILCCFCTAMEECDHLPHLCSSLDTSLSQSHTIRLSWMLLTKQINGSYKVDGINATDLTINPHSYATFCNCTAGWSASTFSVSRSREHNSHTSLVWSPEISC